MQEGQVPFSLFSLPPPADRRQLTASSVELAQLGREAKQSLSGGRSRLVRAAQELPDFRVPVSLSSLNLTQLYCVNDEPRMTMGWH